MTFELLTAVSKKNGASCVSFRWLGFVRLAVPSAMWNNRQRQPARTRASRSRLFSWHIHPRAGKYLEARLVAGSGAKKGLWPIPVR